ncbi:hypothetical protein [Cryobacterium sp. PAMC25264]|uniref:hypothetical protein n=1 Tax=Cryobacterium sp. PAMC25264 TaxID=2861288 RepID=UPI001C63356D|nr:hypothetical protein [Cryobacterium sp. PAMC25264]QYF74298.1 hypothetical protein KY500_03495 [Cryobacterium sp. PAMC25264]
MTPAAALIVLLLLVALSTGLGLLWRHRQGTVSVAARGVPATAPSLRPSWA